MGDGGEGIERREGGGELMVGRNRQGRRPRQLQEPSQVLRFAPEFLTNGGDLARLSFRLKGGDQVAQPRPQLGGVERFVIGKAREIAEQPAEPAQSGRPRFLRAFPRAHATGLRSGDREA